MLGEVQTDGSVCGSHKLASGGDCMEGGGFVSSVQCRLDCWVYTIAQDYF